MAARASREVFFTRQSTVFCCFWVQVWVQHYASDSQLIDLTHRSFETPPMRIIGAQATGAADYWYAKNPDIKTLSDTNGHTIAFSTNGSSTHSVGRAFIDEFKLTAKPQATGNPSAALTAVMTDQVDVGWASPPFGRKEIEEGKIHLVARATDAALVRDQTIRVLVANADALANLKEVI